MRRYDVVIAGGGIAGGFLARQLKLTRPELDILVLESQPEINDFKVGESTVEVAASYMIRRLNLGTYLYQHQLPKNGLRFFFDSPEKDLPLTRMSEIGSDHMPFHPSFQLERAKLERDIAIMNAELGCQVELGAKVTDVRIDGESEHMVAWEKGGERFEASCRWFIDATGRRHLLNRKLGLPVHKETRLNTAAAWGRYRNVAGLDAVTDRAFRERVRYTARHLSTNHFMYDGYWIWFIPLAGDLMSVGVVYDKDRIGPGPRNRAELEAFLHKHRSSRDLMEGAIFEDYQGYAHLPYWSEKYFSKDRWALTGFAGAFTDPFYSPGSDFIATANEFITSLILAEMGGDDTFEARLEAYNAYYRFKYESTLRLYSRMYPIFGSFEIYRLKYLLDFNNYYNLVYWPFLADKLTDLDWVRGELEFTPVVLRALDAMADHFSRMGDVLRTRGEYFAKNEGHWANGLNGVVQLEKRLGPVFDDAFRKEQVDRAYGSVFAAVLERLSGEPGLGDRKPVLDELKLPQVLVFKDINEDSAQRLLDRIARRIGAELRKEFPSVEKVVLGKSLAGDAGLAVIGPPEGGPEHAEVLARARSLWDTSGKSYAYAAL
ncbi:NAD(P)/FAD-dependent oxidoreductase [Polyangium aurulentum]|uniref:NAD(P)/FAD-dependent oxidoreductase n=1 Tax=Polyangium aurulentum TaxID=2567896 RepID=UPI0010ADBDAF|nr:tryptophan 7-halogenase [Polyangium aurulentum]UQA63327.1 tryptophan 7-halogenase [Polyangium aurulentum]